MVQRKSFSEKLIITLNLLKLIIILKRDINTYNDEGIMMYN